MVHPLSTDPSPIVQPGPIAAPSWIVQSRPIREGPVTLEFPSMVVPAPTTTPESTCPLIEAPGWTLPAIPSRYKSVRFNTSQGFPSSFHSRTGKQRMGMFSSTMSWSVSVISTSPRFGLGFVLSILSKMSFPKT